MSNSAHNSSNRAQSSGSGASNGSSLAEIARPGTSSGPRTTTANTHFYAMEPRGVDDSIQRPPSSTSVPSYHSNTPPPTYHSQQSDRASAHSGNPPSYHSTDPNVSAPRPASRGQGQQAQPQMQQPPPRQQQELSTSERIRNTIRRLNPRNRRNQGSGSGGRR